MSSLSVRSQLIHSIQVGDKRGAMDLLAKPDLRLDEMQIRYIRRLLKFSHEGASQLVGKIVPLLPAPAPMAKLNEGAPRAFVRRELTHTQLKQAQRELEQQKAEAQQRELGQQNAVAPQRELGQQKAARQALPSDIPNFMITTRPTKSEKSSPGWQLIKHIAILVFVIGIIVAAWKVLALFGLIYAAVKITLIVASVIGGMIASRQLFSKIPDAWERIGY